MKITKPINPTQIISRFRREEDLTLEEIGLQDYGIEDPEKFLDLLEVKLGSREFKKYSKRNENKKTKKKKARENSIINKGSESEMKARMVRRVVDKEVKENTCMQKVPGCSVLASPEERIKNLKKKIISDVKKARTEEMEKKVDKDENTLEATTVNVDKPNEEENKMKDINQMTLEELQMRKQAIESQLSAEKSEYEYKKDILIPSLKEERKALELKVEELKGQLKETENSLLNAECKLEDTEKALSKCDVIIKKYNSELISVEELISKNTVVFLLSPSYGGHPKMDGYKYISSSPIREGVEVDPFGEDIVDGMTRKEIKVLAAENGYTDIERFAMDYAFTLLVKNYHEKEIKYVVKTRVGSPVNTLLDKYIGQDKWNHD